MSEIVLTKIAADLSNDNSNCSSTIQNFF